MNGTFVSIAALTWDGLAWCLLETWVGKGGLDSIRDSSSSPCHPRVSIWSASLPSSMTSTGHLIPSDGMHLQRGKAPLTPFFTCT